LFVAPLTTPYGYYNNIPLFADPEFFAGIFCLPNLETVWPQTINRQYQQIKFLDILKVSTEQVKVIETQK